MWPLHVSLLAALVVLELTKIPLAKLTGVSVKTLPFAPDSPALPEAILTNLSSCTRSASTNRLTWNYPSWSISTEFFPYLVFAAVALTALRWFLLSLALGALSALVVVVFSDSLMNTTYDYGLFRCLYGLFVGHLVFRIWNNGAVPLRHATAAEIGVIAAAFALVAVLGNTPWAFASPLLFGVAVWVFAQEKGAVSRVMKSRPIVLLGTWSYSIYMVHAVVVVFMNRGFAVLEKLIGWPLITIGPSLEGTSLRQVISFGGPWVMDVLAVVYLGVVVAAASLTYRYIEVPGREFFNRLAAALTARSLRTRAAAP